MIFAIVSKQMESMMSVDDFYVFFCTTFFQNHVSPKTSFLKRVRGCGWEVFDLRVLRTVITDFIRHTKQISNDTSILG